MQGAHYYRIPSIAALDRQRVIAFANRRIQTFEDQAREVHLVAKIIDGKSHGANSAVVDIVAENGWIAAIGTVVITREDASIALSYGFSPRSKMAHAQVEKRIHQPGFFLCSSADPFRAWTKTPMHLCAGDTRRVIHSHGSSQGIKLKYGKTKDRLVVPARYSTKPGENLEALQRHHYNCALYSDDGGKTWNISTPVQVGTGEGCLVELCDGRIYFNSRAYFLDGKRRTAWSYDGGETFTDFGVADQLSEPLRGGCNAGMAVYRSIRPGESEAILFSNPAGQQRERMTVSASFDGGRTWPVAKCINEGPSGYSAMAVGNDGTIYVLYENGDQHPYERISLAAFNLEWLMGGDAAHMPE